MTFWEKPPILSYGLLGADSKGRVVSTSKTIHAATKGMLLGARSMPAGKGLWKGSLSGKVVSNKMVEHIYSGVYSLFGNKNI